MEFLVGNYRALLILLLVPIAQVMAESRTAIVFTPTDVVRLTAFGSPHRIAFDQIVGVNATRIPVWGLGRYPTLDSGVVIKLRWSGEIRVEWRLNVEKREEVIQRLRDVARTNLR